MHSDRYLACFQTLVWLREEGFIRFAQTLRADAVEQAALTGRCLALLIQPSSLEGNSAAIAVETNTLLSHFDMHCRKDHQPQCVCSYSI